MSNHIPETPLRNARLVSRERIARVSRWVRHGLLVLMVLTLAVPVLFLAVYWAHSKNVVHEPMLWEQARNGAALKWDPFAFASVLVSSVLIACTLQRARRLFGTFMAGEYFTESVCNQLVALGRWMLAVGIVNVPLQSLARSLQSGMFTAAFSLSDFLLMFAGALCLVIGWVQREAVRIQQEYAEIV